MCTTLAVLRLSKAAAALMTGVGHCNTLSVLDTISLSNIYGHQYIDIYNYFPIPCNTQSLYATFVRSVSGTGDIPCANSFGLIVTLFVTSCVLYMPTRRSASSNMLFRSEIMMNWASLVLS